MRRDVINVPGLVVASRGLCGRCGRWKSGLRVLLCTGDEPSTAERCDWYVARTMIKRVSGQP